MYRTIRRRRGPRQASVSVDLRNNRVIQPIFGPGVHHYSMRCSSSPTMGWELTADCLPLWRTQQTIFGFSLSAANHDGPSPPARHLLQRLHVDVTGDCKITRCHGPNTTVTGACNCPFGVAALPAANASVSLTYLAPPGCMRWMREESHLYICPARGAHARDAAAALRATCTRAAPHRPHLPPHHHALLPHISQWSVRRIVTLHARHHGIYVCLCLPPVAVGTLYTVRHIHTYAPHFPERKKLSVRSLYYQFIHTHPTHTANISRIRATRAALRTRSTRRQTISLLPIYHSYYKYTVLYSSSLGSHTVFYVDLKDDDTTDTTTQSCPLHTTTHTRLHTLPTPPPTRPQRREGGNQTNVIIYTLATRTAHF